MAWFIAQSGPHIQASISKIECITTFFAQISAQKETARENDPDSQARCNFLASRAGVYARSPAPICRRAAARRCMFLASRAGIHACLPAPICRRAAARRCILLAHAAARRCIFLASRAGSIYAWLPAPTCIFLASRACPPAAANLQPQCVASLRWRAPAQVFTPAWRALPAPSNSST